MDRPGSRILKNALPVSNVNPLIELKSDLPEIRDFRKPESFKKSDAGACKIGKR